jgi:DNA-binding transcriptional MerR regulator
MNQTEQSYTYKIGEVAKKVAVEPYVLRFWENEFSQLKPIRSPKGQRLYTDAHVALIRQIKYLLYDQGLTIESAKRRLDANVNWLSFVEEMKQEVQEIRRMLLKS